MIGTIHSDQKCPVCGSRFSDNKKNALVCEDHPEQRASKFRVYFKGVTKRFSSYDDAVRYLTGLRFKTDECTFDERDYKKDNPLGFENLANEWKEIKQNEIKSGSFKEINGHINAAIKWWGNTNIKDIKPKDIQLFLNSLDVADKTKHNYNATLKQFWRWLFDNDEIAKLPKFPKVKFNLAWRKTVDKDTQQMIIDEVHRIADPINIRIAIGIEILATNFNTRPGELIKIKESDIDLAQARILLRDTKDRPKYIYLIPEHVGMIESLPRGLPHLYFFRHKSGLSGVQAGTRFGDKYFSKYWKKACKNLGIQDVDLYGGTRHSTVSALRHKYSPEEIKRASMHCTNKAFDRYFQIEPEELRKIYQDTKVGKKLAKKDRG